MKQLGIQSLVVLFLVLCLNACASVKSWSTANEKQQATVELGEVRVDKTSGWDSVQAETCRILPLLLAKEGYLHSLDGKNKYRAEAAIIEREYMENWRTCRSLSAEVSIWDNESANPRSVSVPLAAGKAVLTNTKKSFSSSKELYRLLKKALNGALRSMP